MALIVQKFGGTSVNTAEKREKVLNRIISMKDQGDDVVVVVSAMGRKGEPYATDSFLDLLQQVAPNPDGQTKDLLASCGEIITSCIVAHALEAKGYKACAMTGLQAGIVTDENFTNARIKEINPVRVHKALGEGKIVIIAGFQGYTEDMNITTLGRGGSDTTAIALGGALGADIIEIYTDVPGIAFTDPRLIAEAPFINNIAFNPMHKLARAGAKVIHPRAVNAAIVYDIPFVVRSTFSDEPGTTIGKEGECVGGIYGMAILKDIFILKTKNCENWKKLAVDEMFFKSDADGCQLAVQAQSNSLDKEDVAVSGECDLVTVVWNEEKGITFDIVHEILTKLEIEIQAFFDIESGGAWAVSANKGPELMRHLFDHFSDNKVLAV